MRDPRLQPRNSARSMRGPLAIVLAAMAATSHGDGGPRVVSTEYLGPFTGMEAQLHPKNQWPVTIDYWGTDLGFSYAHQGKIHWLFGDTLASPTEVIEASSGRLRDDGFGWIPLDAWPDPAQITRDNLPLIRLGQNPGTAEMSAINPEMTFDGLKTPEAGFSNGSNEFAVLLIGKPQGCRNDGDCGSQLDCDTRLGYWGTPFSEQPGWTLACLDDDPRCSPDTVFRLDEAAVPETGFCVDPSSSVWNGTPAGSVAATALRQSVAIRGVRDPRRYRFLHQWMTNKFQNTTVSTVARFVPSREAPQTDPDYRTPDRADARAAVLVWGRPGFIGVGARGRSLGLYFAYSNMPKAPDFQWELHYFSGVDEDGKPRFSRSEREATALDLDASQTGVQPEETHDLIQHMSIRWVDSLDKWVMFYGGGIDETPISALGFEKCGLLEVFSGPECEHVVPGTRSVRMRTADHPWGPWSVPQDVLDGTDPARAGVGQYGPGGSMYHPECGQPGCAPHSAIPVFHDDGFGWLYGVNIVEQWTRPAGDGVDLIWNVSTWDPYRVVLYRTRIKP